MKQDRRESAEEGVRGHRRFAHLTRADVVLLDELKRTTGPAAAKEFERFIRAQHTEQQAFRRRVTIEAGLGVDLDVVLAARTAPPRTHRDDRRRVRRPR